jgi:hypothetical protein
MTGWLRSRGDHCRDVFSREASTPEFKRGDRIALVSTDDPYTQLVPGDKGSVRSYDPNRAVLQVQWDSGSTLAMLLASGDEVCREEES